MYVLRFALGFLGFVLVVGATSSARASDGSCLVNFGGGPSGTCPPAPVQLSWCRPDIAVGTACGSGYADFGIVLGTTFSSGLAAINANAHSNDQFILVDGPVGQSVPVTAQFEIDYSVEEVSATANFVSLQGAPGRIVVTDQVSPPGSVQVCRTGFFSPIPTGECAPGTAASGSDIIEVDFSVVSGFCFNLNIAVLASTGGGSPTQIALATARSLDPPVTGFDPQVYTLKQCNGEDVVPVPEPSRALLLSSGVAYLWVLAWRRRLWA